MQKELAQLRTELDRVRKRESELLLELFDARAATEIQNQKIRDSIARIQPIAVIGHLPTDVLSRILYFALYVTHCREWVRHPLQKRQFAGVSRRWRDVILNSPSLWTAICVCPSWSLSYVEQHVARSREHPLDITIRNWSSFSSIGAHLHPIRRCAHLWHSLTIYAGVEVARFLLRDLSKLSFPCLKSIHIQSTGDFDAEFPMADNTPALEQLLLKNCRPPVPLLPSLAKLTTLMFYGDMDRWQLEPRSIHLPLLRSLTIDVDNPNMLLKAIVAPELSHFDYRGRNCREVPSVFDGLLSPFNKVHYIRLRALSKDPVATVCRTFPNVRHFEMLYPPSGFFYGLRETTGLWGDLECVTFRSLRVNLLEEVVTELQAWLQQRKPTAKPLHMRFTCIKHGVYWTTTGKTLSMLYDALHHNCTFEVDRFPFTERIRMTSLTRTLHLVRKFTVSSSRL
ncbi:hypothetical protein EDC04DRAFT_790750 [Pisolithus marmoratus]|nr:hypothetical protein EDC04DRAFT_790750 [Pisolithus marmoratus]